MGIISTSPERDKVWHVGTGIYWGLMEDAIQLHQNDAQVVDALKGGIAASGLSLELLDEILADRVTVALIQTARTILDPSSRHLVQSHLILPEPGRQGYLNALAELIELLEMDRGRERVGVVSVFEDNEWVVPRWILARLLDDAMRYHGQDAELERLLDMAVAAGDLRFNRASIDVAKAEIAAVLQTVRTTIEGSSRDALNWHVGLDDERQQAYLAAVASLRDFLETERRRLDEPPPSADPMPTPEERAALIEAITNIWRAGHPAGTDDPGRNDAAKDEVDKWN